MYKISFSLTSHVDIAITKSGNLIQLTPFSKETSTFAENKEEIIPVIKKIIAHLIQLNLIHSHENFMIDFIKNESPIITINKSINDLLNIIKKGIKVHNKIRNFSKFDFF